MAFFDTSSSYLYRTLRGSGLAVDTPPPVLVLLAAATAAAAGFLFYIFVCLAVPLLSALLFGTAAGNVLGLVLAGVELVVWVLVWLGELLRCLLPGFLSLWVQGLVWLLCASKLFWAVVVAAWVLVVLLLTFSLEFRLQQCSTRLLSREDAADLAELDARLLRELQRKNE